MTINDATPAEWDALKNGVLAKEGFPDQKRVERGYWGRFKDDKNGNKVYQSSAVAKDVINNPSHYNQGGLECIDYIEQQLTVEQFEGYLAGNAIKYLHRYQYKNGVEDLRKHQWYVEKLIRAMS
tara:strand:- start:8226 stop:8597 length:372 start_codon:yes stop_codon:yes gene_type:complete